jgi:hypothetical protein
MTPVVLMTVAMTDDPGRKLVLMLSRFQSHAIPWGLSYGGGSDKLSKAHLEADDLPEALVARPALAIRDARVPGLVLEQPARERKRHGETVPLVDGVPRV